MHVQMVNGPIARDSLDCFSDQEADGEQMKGEDTPEGQAVGLAWGVFLKAGRTFWLCSGTRLDQSESRFANPIFFAPAASQHLDSHDLHVLVALLFSNSSDLRLINDGTSSFRSLYLSDTRD